MKSDELKAWREKQGLLQSELAAKLSVHILTVTRWETGTRAIPPYLPLALKTLESPKKPAPKK